MREDEAETGAVRAECGGGGAGLTGAEEGEGPVEAVFVKVAQHRLVRFADLFERAQHHEQEACVAFGDFRGVPFGGCGVVAVTAARGANCRCGGEAAGERQVHPGGEEGVDEAPCIASNAEMWARVGAGAVRPV